MRSPLLVAVVCSCFVFGQGSTPNAAPQSIFGTYAERSTHAGATPRDFIRVKPAANGKIDLALKLYFAGGHVCQLQKQGDWRGDHVLIMTEGLVENQPCKLEASFPRGHVLLKDEAQRCAQLYCGTRGKLDAVSLPKRSSGQK